MPKTKLYLFGAPRLEYQNRLVAIDTRKALALLAYLLIEGKPQSRDTLAALLWPESNQTSARGALRRTLSTLRSALQDDLVDFGREVIALQPDSDLWCDVTIFRGRLADCRIHGHNEDQVCPNCMIPLQEAAELYAADFMAGLSLRDSAEFDNWQFFEADRLRREFTSALERLIMLMQGQGDFLLAIENARRWLALDTLNEAAHRALITLYAQNNQRTAALRQYRECVHILDQELGVSPLDETTHLYEAVKENRVEKPAISRKIFGASQPARDEKDIPSSKTDLFPLVGRSVEWDQLTNLYEALRHDGVFVALTGETGIGKTRLAGDFFSHLRKRGAITLTARCYKDESNLAYTPLIDLLRQGIRQAVGHPWWKKISAHWLAEAAQLLPELSLHVPKLRLPQSEGPGAQNHFFEGLCQVLEALLAGPQTGAVWIDDLHLADKSTLDWLAYLIHRLGSRPIFLLATWESETQPPIQHFQQTLCTILPISPLTVGQSEIMIRTYSRETPLSDAYLDWLVRQSDGRPYILAAYLEAIRQGKISATTIEAGPIPESLQTAWLSQLSNLSESAGQIVQAAAVIGRVFEIDLLQAVSGRSEDEIILGIEELSCWGLIGEARAQSSLGEYDFKHEQVHVLVLGEISLVRRRILHRRTASALQERARRQTTAVMLAQVAYHLQQSGQPDQAAESYFTAGQAARRVFANGDALTYFQTALALGYPKKVAAQVQIGELCALQGNYSQAIQQFESAAAFSTRNELPLIEYKIGLIYLRRGGWEQATCHFEAALSDLVALPPEQQNTFAAQVNADWSLACHRSRKADKAAALAQQALTLAQLADDPLSLAQAHNLLGVLARAGLQSERALAHLNESLTFARKLENPAAQIAALNNLALAQADLDQGMAAIKTVQLAIENCVALGDRHLEAALRNNLADILRANGEQEAAMVQLKQAVAIFAEIGQNADDWEPEIWKLTAW